MSSLDFLVAVAGIGRLKRVLSSHSQIVALLAAFLAAFGSLEVCKVPALNRSSNMFKAIDHSQHLRIFEMMHYFLLAQ